MTSLMEQFRGDQVAARKGKKTEMASILTTLISEAAMIGKNNGNRETTDEEVIAVIKKFIKNSTEVMEHADPTSKTYADAEYEIKFLTMYLPRQMPDDVLRATIATIGEELNLHSPKDMGTLMKILKERHSGSYDSETASTFVREYLNGQVS